MKKTIKTIRGLISLAAVTLIIASCSKDGGNAAAEATALPSLNAITPTYSCGPIPQDLEVPAGNKFAMQTYAQGVQIYQVRRSTVDPTMISWVNIAPAATLYAKPDYTIQVGTHYAGPSWEFTKGPFKGEKVVGSKWKSVIVDQTAVPWLILKAVDSLSSPGNKITYIQRICTTGGLPPSTPATESNLGAIDSIPYTANYLFYIKD